MKAHRFSLNRITESASVAGFVCAFPALLGFVLFVLGPALASMYFSLTQYDVLRPPIYVGSENYRNLMSDPLFWKSLYNTFYLTIFGVPLSLLSGLVLALILNRKIKGVAFFRTLFFLPSLVPLVANAVVWVLFFNGKYGLVNYVLSWFGIRGPSWLASPGWAKPALILMGLWGIGQGMIICLAGLQGVPEEFYEAAEIDGAGMWAKLRYITVPLITPTLFFVAVTSIIAHLQIFVQPYVMTQGGPADSTLTYVYLLYNKAFGWFRMGEGCAMAWLLFVIVLIVTAIQFWTSRYWVHYDLT